LSVADQWLFVLRARSFLFKLLPQAHTDKLGGIFIPSKEAIDIPEAKHHSFEISSNPFVLHNETPKP
jgi:hypothetical protein